jgi:hypothetical protein
MLLLVRSAGATMPLGSAVVVSARATLAEALPLPGGAVVRASALMAAGTGLAQSSALILANALLWISLASLGCGLVLLGHGLQGAPLLALAGAGGSAVTFGWLVRQAGTITGLLTVLHRLSGMALIAVRLKFAFLTFGVAVPLADTLPISPDRPLRSPRPGLASARAWLRPPRERFRSRPPPPFWRSDSTG